MQHDALIIGGSFAGLSAAIHIARARRTVLVIDAGRPRNRFAEHSHGVLALDGRAGSEILALARTQVATYPTATLMRDQAIGATASPDGFTVELADGGCVTGRRLALATGVTDVLPSLPGLAERWGTTVLPCPYCHGYELGGGGGIGVLGMHPLSAHQASLIADWGDVTFFTDGRIDLDDAARAMLETRRVVVEPTPVTDLVGTSPALDGVRLQDGRIVPVRALFIAAPVRMTSPIAEQLGCAFDAGPLGPIVRTDMWQQTTVPGVYAAGDAAQLRPSITFASADGVAAGVGLHQSLVAEDGAAR